MSNIVVTLLSSGAPVNSLADTPEITIRRADTGVAVTTNDTMTDSGGDGHYRYSFTAVRGVPYTFLIDADPNATGQVDVRYFDGAFDQDLKDIWNDRGLNPDDAKVITENTLGTNYSEDVPAATPVNKTVIKSGTTTTITRI